VESKIENRERTCIAVNRDDDRCLRQSLIVVPPLEIRFEVGEIVVRIDRCSRQRLDAKWVTVRRRYLPP